MECDVLIYGFGYTGKKALKLCETFSLSYLIIDDGLNIKTIDKFINLNSLKSCKLALICVCDKKEIQEKIKQKLLDKNIDKNIIKVANFAGIKNEIFETLYNGYKDKNLLQVIINDDYYMSNFLKILEISQKEYMANKVKQLENIKELRYNLDNNLKNQNIFSKLYDMTMPYNDTEVLKYPFFYTLADKNLDDKNFYFREKIDFQALKNRDKDTKLILCFGASAMRCHDIEIESTISGVIKEELTKNNGGGGKKYLVYNLGISGYTTLDMFMLYSSLFYSIRPDIVITMFFGSEIVSGAMSDKTLLEDHNLYHTQILEKNIKKSQRSIMPTLSDVRDIIEKPITA